MDRLPVELISIIGHGLQELHVSKEPFSYLTETNKEQDDGWLVHTINSRSDICNFRLVSRKFCASSLSTFGHVLGDRVFRISRVGLEDMHDISQAESLRHHISGLTFGSAVFDDISQNVVLQQILHVLPEPDKSRLESAYAHCHQWQQYQGVSCAPELTQALSHFPRLRRLRIVLNDNANMSNHLGGWLGRGDKTMVASAFTEGVSPELVDDRIYGFVLTDLSWLAPVFAAMKSTGTVMNDLSIGCGVALPPNEVYRLLRKVDMIANLSRLRLEVDPLWLSERDSYYCSCLDDTFQGLVTLTHLTLSMPRHIGLELDSLAGPTACLLEFLTPLEHLQNLTLRGSWRYSEDHLINLVSARRETLRLLSLKDAIMDLGDWGSAITRLVRLESSVLQHLEVSNMKTMGQIATDTIILDTPSTSDWQNLVLSVRKAIEERSTCAVYLTSSVGTYLYTPSKSVDGIARSEYCLSNPHG
ncbi:hypothetical protein ACEQ8H_004828 [Pleosporales sp. CAS-2024a]